jgi:hypothetical protein
MVKIRNFAHLKEIIQKATQQVSRDMLQRVWQEVEYMLNIWKATNSAQ